MDESWTVTKTVTPHFFWNAWLYPVKWADQPEDVPIYDSSRGASPELVFQDPPLSKETLDSILRVSERFGSEILEQLIDDDETLGGHLPAPPLISRYARLQGGDVQISERVNYPRLVRASKEEGGRLDRDAYVDFVVVKALAELASIANEEEFRQQVVKFAEAYSLLNPYQPHADTLVGWRWATETADFWLHYLELHSKLRFARPSNYIPTLLEFVENHPAEEAKLLKKWFNDMHRHDPEPELELSNKRKRERFRAQVGEYLFRHFNENLHGLRFAFSPHAFFVTCGSLGWMYREVWELNGGGTLTKVCQNPGCRRFMTAKNKKQLYCNDACKMAASRARSCRASPRRAGSGKEAC